jgi:hypothetical protein
MAGIWQTPPCVKKAGGSAISLVNSMIPVSTRRQRECGVASPARNVHVTFRETKIKPRSLFAGKATNRSQKKQPARAGCFSDTKSGLRSYAVFSSVPLAVVDGVASVWGVGGLAGFLRRPFVGGALASVTSSIMHMGDASPRRNPTLTIRV